MLADWLRDIPLGRERSTSRATITVSATTYLTVLEPRGLGGRDVFESIARDASRILEWERMRFVK